MQEACKTLPQSHECVQFFVGTQLTESSAIDNSLNQTLNVVNQPKNYEHVSLQNSLIKNPKVMATHKLNQQAQPPAHINCEGRRERTAWNYRSQETTHPPECTPQ